MKILILIIIGLSGLFSCAGEPAQSGLLSQVVSASKKNSSIKFGSGDTTREITFHDGEEDRLHPVEPMILVISKVIQRNYFPELREVDLLEARDAYAKYFEEVKKAREEAELHLWLSKETDENLLKKVLSTVCPKGASSVWIQYFESHPIRRDPIYIHKPVPPQNQKNPAQQGVAPNRSLPPS
jgi:hypothetical protein